MKPMSQIIFGRVVKAILLCTALLFVAVSVHVSTEFREELVARTEHTASLILSVASSMPHSNWPEQASGLSVLENEELDYVVALFRDDELLYASPPGFDPAADLQTKSEMVVGHKTYLLTHAADVENALQVTVGLLNIEPYFSSFEIVLLTVAIFITSTILLLAMTRQSIVTGLKPLKTLAKDVSLRAPEKMTPLATQGLPPELIPIASATNSLLERLDAAMERERAFVANAAHELRTPLTGILAQAEAIDEAEISPQAQARLDKIKLSARRSSRQLSQLLDHAFAHSQVDADVEVPINLSEIIQNLLADAALPALASNTDIELFDDRECWAHVNEVLITIVLKNLIDNAIKYCGSPGKVQVSVRNGPKGNVIVSISDNGTGMSEAAFALASGRFQRLEGANSALGYGLGLTITTELCDRLGVVLTRKKSVALGGLQMDIDIAASPNRLTKSV